MQMKFTIFFINNIILGINGPWSMEMYSRKYSKDSQHSLYSILRNLFSLWTASVSVPSILKPSSKCHRCYFPPDGSPDKMRKTQSFMRVIQNSFSLKLCAFPANRRS